MKLKFSLISLFALLWMFSCNKPQNTPQPQPLPSESIKNIDLNNRSLTYDNKLFQTKTGEVGFFTSGFSSVNTFRLTGKDSLTKVIMTITLQSSNPPDGVYSLGDFEIFSSNDIYPGKGKAQLAVEMEGLKYYSKESIEKLIKITHMNDSIEVSFNQCKLYQQFGTLNVSGKIMLATKPEKIVYTGNAIFYKGRADTLNYSVNNGIHTYHFYSRVRVFMGNHLFLRFTEPLNETKMYKITHRYPPNDNEISLTLYTKEGDIYNPSALYNTDGRLYVTKQDNGDFKFTFENIPKNDGLKTTLFGSGVISSFMP